MKQEARELAEWNAATKIVMPFTCDNQRAAFSIILALPGAKMRSQGQELTVLSAPSKMAWVLWQLSKAGAHGARYA